MQNSVNYLEKNESIIMEKIFTKTFTQQEPIPQEGIDNAIAIMKSGRLHRYNVSDGETSVTSNLEVLY